MNAKTTKADRLKTLSARIALERVRANRAAGHVPKLRQGPNWTAELEAHRAAEWLAVILGRAFKDEL